MSEHKSGAVSREYHIAVIEKKDRELHALKDQRDELLAVVKYTRQVLPQDKWADDLKVMLNTAIANAEKDKL